MNPLIESTLAAVLRAFRRLLPVATLLLCGFAAQAAFIAAGVNRDNYSANAPGYGSAADHPVSPNNVWAYRLNRADRGSGFGTVDFLFPGNVPQQRLNTLQVHTDFLMVNANDARVDGFAFRYGNLNGPYTLTGDFSGLEVLFRPGILANANPNTVQIYYNGRLIAQTGALDLVDGNYEHKWNTFNLDFDPATGLTMTIYQVDEQYNASLVATVCQNAPIPDWNPAYYWACRFMGYSGSYACNTFINNIVIYGDTDPTISGGPGFAQSDENTPGYVPFTVGDLEDVNGVVMNAYSSDESVVPSSGISFVGTGPYRTMVVQPTHNQFGTVLLTISATQAGRTAYTYLTYTVNHVDVPPEINPLYDLTIAEDSPPTSLNLSGINGGDVRFPKTVTVSASSDNPTVLPDPTIQYFGGSYGALTLLPALHQSGVAHVTVSVSDGSNTTTTTFAVNVNAINYPPIIGSGSAIRLGGLTNSYLVVSNVGNILPATGVTVEFWQKVNKSQRQATFRMVQDDSTNEFKGIVPWESYEVFWQFGDVYNASGSLYLSPRDNFVGWWHHWAFVVDPNYMSIYEDGNLAAIQQFPSTFAPGNYDLQIGGISLDGTDPYDGEIGEFRVWQEARTANQLQQFMNQAAPTNDPALLIYYQFNEGGGDVVHDLATDAMSQAGSQDATLINGPTWESVVVDGPPQTLPILAVENRGVDIILPAFDLETSPTALQYANVTVSGGTIRQTHPGSWHLAHYTPPANFNGLVTLYYEVSDVPFAGTVSNTIPILVQRVNLPPIISVIANQTVEENSDSLDIPFTVTDDKPSTDVITLAYLSDPSLATASISSDSSGVNRVFSIHPQPDTIGALSVTLVAIDKELGHTTNTFEVRIEPPPAYGVIDLGILPGKSTSFGLGINDQGAVIGFAADNGSGLSPEGFVYNGLENGGVLSSLTPFGSYSRPMGINNDFTIVGAAQTNMQFDAFMSGISGVFDLAGGMFVSNTVATSISGAGAVAGYGSLAGGTTNSFLYIPSIGLSMLPTPAYPFNASAAAMAVNLNGNAVGIATSMDGISGAFIYNYVSGTSSTLGIAGETNSVALGINSFDAVTGGVYTNGVEQAFVWSGGQTAFLGMLPGGGASEGRAINDFGQVTGTGLGQFGDKHAIVYTTGRLRDLNDLIPETDATGWVLKEGNAINRSGAIAGTGTYNGVPRAFLALPATVIGTPVLRPLGAAVRNPQITLLRRNQADDNAGNAFLWNSLEGQLYAIRPVVARIDWYTSLQDTTGAGADLSVNSSRITTVSINVWPRKPNVHIVGAPVQLEPDGIPFPYAYQAVLFQTNSSSVEPSSKTFTSPGPGYSVVYFLKNNGGIPNPLNQHPHFEVVRSYYWNDPQVLPPDMPWRVGDELVDPLHAEYGGRNGYVVFEQAPYDGIGNDRAYDRPSRLGPIIPVNTKQPGGNPLAVVWYRTNTIGIAWASAPVRYALSWPDDQTNKIIIASQLGSGVLDSATYRSKRVYVQPDPNLAGFNPNEEHALIGASFAGEALFALRVDLNSINNYSAPYALLKYKDAVAGRWHIRPFKVVAEEAPYFFSYPGLAGFELQAPMPLPLLPNCQQSLGVSGPYWRDYKGKFYARAAGPQGSGTNVVLRYFYPLQSGFYYPDTNVSIGDCVAWLDRLRTNNPPGQPVDINFAVNWTNYPVLQIGQTLLKAKNGLPSVFNMAAAQIIVDDLELNPNFADGLARFYDPVSARTLSTPVSVPGALRRNNVGGKDQFSDLPWHLKVRLGYDSVNRQLSFAGYYDPNFGAGDPLLLPNVMSERERDRIKQLTGALSQEEKISWSDAIDKLYDLTRNPNGVDLSPQDGLPDKDLRLGLTMIGNNVIRENFGSGPKALTAGILNVPPALPNPLQAVSLNGVTGHLPIGSSDSQGLLSLQSSSFTIEFWAQLGALSKDQYIVSQDGPDSFGKLRIGFRSSGEFAFDLGTTPESRFNTAFKYADTNWHHWACTLDSSTGVQTIYRDGLRVAARTNTASYVGAGTIDIGRTPAGSYFTGQLDEFRLWRQPQSSLDVPHLMRKRLLGGEAGLAVYYRFDEGHGTSAQNSAPGGYDASLQGGVGWVDSTAPAAIPPRYVTLAENNDSSLPGLPVALHVIQIDDGPFLGDLKVLAGDNVFDERVTVRHSDDFGGDPGRLFFEWYYKPQGPDFDPTDLPEVSSDGTIADPHGWTRLGTSYASETTGRGFNYVTLGEGQESSLITLSDNGFIGRYRGYAVGLSDTNTWSGWVGDPSGTPSQPRAALVEGWVKRVVRGLNPFDARTADFHDSAAAT